MTVDPVQDDIEIVNDGEGTDAFAVSPFLVFTCHCVAFFIQPLQDRI